MHMGHIRLGRAAPTSTGRRSTRVDRGCVVGTTLRTQGGVGSKRTWVQTSETDKMQLSSAQGFAAT